MLLMGLAVSEQCGYLCAYQLKNIYQVWSFEYIDKVLNSSAGVKVEVADVILQGGPGRRA